MARNSVPYKEPAARNTVEKTALRAKQTLSIPRTRPRHRASRGVKAVSMSADSRPHPTRRGLESVSMSAESRPRPVPGAKRENGSSLPIPTIRTRLRGAIRDSGNQARAEPSASAAAWTNKGAGAPGRGHGSRPSRATADAAGRSSPRHAGREGILDPHVRLQTPHRPGTPEPHNDAPSLHRVALWRCPFTLKARRCAEPRDFCFTISQAPQGVRTISR
jgi:hypothetical protein